MKKRLMCIIAVATIILSGAVQTQAAKNNNYDFYFEIKSYQKNSNTETRYRGTKNPKCAWMVNFTGSTEDSKGKKCCTTFWLERSSIIGYLQAADDAIIKEGTGKHYYPSDKSATQTNVRLAGENNNYNSRVYTAVGFWDEEADVILK